MVVAESWIDNVNNFSWSHIFCRQLHVAEYWLSRLLVDWLIPLANGIRTQPVAPWLVQENASPDRESPKDNP